MMSCKTCGGKTEPGTSECQGCYGARMSEAFAAQDRAIAACRDEGHLPSVDLAFSPSVQACPRCWQVVGAVAEGERR